MTDDSPDRWLCACGEWTSVTHWAWPEGVGVHDPDLAFSEAAGLAKQGDGPTPANGASPAPQNDPDESTVDRWKAEVEALSPCDPDESDPEGSS